MTSSATAVQPCGGDRLAFLHIPKTGGTTLDHILRQQFLPEEQCPERLAGLAQWPPALLAEYRYFSAHDAFDSFQRHVPKPFRMVTILREPHDRLISHYLYWRSFTRSHIEANGLNYCRLAKLYDFKDYLRCPVASLRTVTENLMTRHLTHRFLKNERELWTAADDSEMLDRALANLSRIDVHGVAEFMDESVEAICKYFDLALPAVVPRMNQTKLNYPENPAIFERVEDFVIDDETEELLQQANRLDTIVYKEALKPFVERAKSHGRRLSGFMSLCGRSVAHYARTVYTAGPGEQGFVLYGPYIRLRRGHYTVSLELKLSDLPAGLTDGDELGFVEVSSNKSGEIHGRHVLRIGDAGADGYRMLHLDFALARTVMDLEIRVHTAGRCTCSVSQDVRLRDRG